MIYTIILNTISEINDNDSKHFADLDRREEEVKCKISQISHVVAELEKLIKSGNVSLVSEYQSQVSEFRKLPSQLKVTLPRFSSGSISTEQLNHHFGYLSKLSLATEERMYNSEIHKEQPYSSEVGMLDKHQLLTCFDTHKILINVSCMSDEEIWTGGSDNIIKLYNLKGELLQSVQTKSGKWPRGIYASATQKGDLMYADFENGSINIVKNKETKQLIRKTGWKPRTVCNTANGDILTIMDNDEGNQTKVVRYSGTTETQSIQWNDDGQPLFLSGRENVKHLTYNRNFDICVSDRDAHTVVVVDHAGKLRFRYTGSPVSSKERFDPRGVATDVQGRILIADCTNGRIHILDQDGHFLRCIDNCQLNLPCGLCLDSKDNLVVAEFKGKVKKIKYY